MTIERKPASSRSPALLLLQRFGKAREDFSDLIHNARGNPHLLVGAEVGIFGEPWEPCGLQRLRLANSLYSTEPAVNTGLSRCTNDELTGSRARCVSCTTISGAST
jgi:hypothetical protein